MFALQYLQIGAGLLVTFLNAGLWIKQRTFVIAFWSFCCSVMTLESLLKCDIISHKLKTNATKLFPHHLGIWGNCPVHLELNYHTTTPTSLSGMSDQEEHDNDG